MTNKKKIESIVDLHTCIQGEGRDTGTPALLIRFSGCNMNCQFKDWICDSAYTSWSPEKGKYSLADVERLILDNPQIKYSFITGGNPSYTPMLLKDVAALLKACGHYVAIEDNGTLYNNWCAKDVDFVTLSPKLSNSIPIPNSVIKDKGVDRTRVNEEDYFKHERYRTNYTSMKQWISNHDYQLKFVISESKQLEEVEMLIGKIGASKDRVYLMPEGVTRTQLDKRRKFLVELCIEKGFKYTDRLHIITYDNKREA